MALRAKMMGREALMRRLNELAPSAEKYAADAKLEVVKEAAIRISAAAPHDTGDYMNSIKGERQADNPNHAPVVGRQSKDPHATAVYAPFIWRFLEFGTKASPGQAPHRDRRYKDRVVMTQGKRSHAATPAIPHVFPVWRDFKPKARRMVNAAINRAVKEVQGRK